MIAPPPRLRAARPTRLRGLRRDMARLLVVNRTARTVSHLGFRDIGTVLRPGDLLVVNSSRVVPSAIPARRAEGEVVQLRPWVRRTGRWDALAVQANPPHANVTLRNGETLAAEGGLRARVLGRREDAPLLWRLAVDGDALDALLRHADPVRYSYVPEPVPLEHYQTVYAAHPGSAEAPSAGLAFTWELLHGLRGAGVGLTDIVLHTGLSSFQDDDVDAQHLLVEEWFSVGENTVAAVAGADRVIAVGTTVVRALESAALGRGGLGPMSGWTNLAIGPNSRIRVADALLTGLHEPMASHLELVRAFLDDGLLERAQREAVEREYLWHEFGDLMLIL
ncbi:MAG: S-adenosylmethionine:tRNA ribosyltransferase-isomerase [Candidatus Dormibacteria bacterium]